ncbi:MAG: winged helix-turn-helix domain-containing protein [Acidimicrobiia bacterium]
MAKNDTWVERTGVRLRGVMEFLRDHGGTATRADILAFVDPLLTPTEHEASLRSNGQPVWLNDVLWQTTTLVKAGWMTKDGAGTWTITPAGLEALDQFPEGLSLHREANRRFNAWRRERNEQQRRRAWLIRGNSVRGADLVPDWLEHGYCSVAASRLSAIAAGISVADLEATLKDDYAHLNASELKAQVDEIVPFITRMSPGDIVLTTQGESVFVGDVADEWTFEISDGNRSNLRRRVDWRNSDSPLERGELPAPLPARLLTGTTLLDLTSDLDLIDDLTTPAEVVPDDPDDLSGGARKPRHEHLGQPSEGLAADLFVDSAAR